MTELQQLRSHYDKLPPNVKARTTAKSLLRAIQIAESLRGAIERFVASQEPTHVAIVELRAAVARVTKEGE